MAKAKAEVPAGVEDREVDNLRIWNAVMHTAPSATKNFTRRGGFRGTAIKPMWTIQQATAFFGPVGIGWGYDILEDREVHAQDGNAVWFSKVQVWFMEGGEKRFTPPQWGGTIFIESKPAREWDEATQKMVPIKGGGMTMEIDDEAPKKSVTDGLTKCLSYLGFAADVHLGMFEDSKYRAWLQEGEQRQGRQAEQQHQEKREPTDDEKWRDEVVKKARGIIDPAELRELWDAARKEFDRLKKTQDGRAIAAFVKHAIEEQRIKIVGKDPGIDQPRKHAEQQSGDDGGEQDRRDQRSIMEK